MRHSVTARTLILLRHGATQPNLDGLRCGGDLDAPLSYTGREQVVQAARRVLAEGWPVDAIFASDLQRTHESARIASELLGGLPVIIEPGFRERLLGDWNMQPVADNAAALAQGVTPPGGESNAVFAARIDGAIRALLARRFASPMLIGSRGVARVLRERLALPRSEPLRNGELWRLDLSELVPPHDAAGAMGWTPQWGYVAT